MPQENEDNKASDEPGKRNKRIIFSTLETQEEILSRHSLSLTPIERLQLMTQLNELAFKDFHREQFNPKGSRITFKHYELH